MNAFAKVLTIPVGAPKRRVVRSRCAHLEAAQLEGFMMAAKAHGVREWAMFIFAFSHGARVSEICDLWWSDINFHTKQVTIARKKHSLEQTQTFLKVKGSAVFDEEKALRAWQAERAADGDDFVFNSQRSTKLNRTTAYKLFAKIAERAGIPASHHHPHVLKHTLGTLMAQKGASAFAIQQKLGHRSISSTAVYVNLTSQQADSVSAAIMNQLL
jgi:type 1 fimbriae regulatory protein FimB